VRLLCMPKKAPENDKSGYVGRLLNTLGLCLCASGLLLLLQVVDGGSCQLVAWVRSLCTNKERWGVEAGFGAAPAIWNEVPLPAGYTAVPVLVSGWKTTAGVT
jgi:hypothetical protein